MINGASESGEYRMGYDAELAAALATITSRLGAASPTKPPEPKVLALWPQYVRAERTAVAGSWNTKEGRMRLHVLPFFGHVLPADIDLSMCDEYREYRSNQTTCRKNPDGTHKYVTQVTINRELEDLRRLLNWAKKRKLCSNPLADIERKDLFREEHNVRRSILEPETLSEILGAAGQVLGDNATAFRAFLLLKVDSGMRREEVATITRPQLDYENGIVKVWWSKTDEPRETRFSERAQEAIRLLNIDQRMRGLPEACRYVFANADGSGHIHKDTFTGWVRKVCEESGIEGPDGRYWLHDARRTFVTFCDRAGVNMADAMDMTGHKTTSTYKRYHVGSRRNLVRAIKRLRGLETDTE